MSKQLYPKPKKAESKSVVKARENLNNRPYHVYYYDPDNETATPEWGHYNSLTAVKVDAFYRVKVLGFLTGATLYERDELTIGDRNG